MTNPPQSSADQWKLIFSVPADPGFGIHEVVAADFDSVPKVPQTVKLNIKGKRVGVEFAVIAVELRFLEQEARIELRKWDQSLQSN